MTDETFNGTESETNEVWHTGRSNSYYTPYNDYMYSYAAPGSRIPGGSTPSDPSGSYGNTSISSPPLMYAGVPNFGNFEFVNPEAILNEKCPKPKEPSVPAPAAPPAIIATANPPIGQSANWLDRLQMGLDVAGFTPVVGSAADLINGGIHLARGNYVDAGFSVIAIVPVYGDAVAGARKIAKAADKAGGIAGQTVKHAENLVDAGKQAAKTFPKASSQRLGSNLEKAGMPKPTKTSQAHHDLPKARQKDFNRVGLDTDAAEYGRWVEGAQAGVKNTGTHQNWSKAFNEEWDKFFKKYPDADKEQILEQMYKMRNNPKYQ